MNFARTWTDKIQRTALTVLAVATPVYCTPAGYGDYSPHSVAGRIIACAYLLGATIIIAVLFDKLSSYMVDARVEKRRNQVCLELVFDERQVGKVEFHELVFLVLSRQALESYGKGLDKGELSDIVKETCTMFSDDGKACSKVHVSSFWVACQTRSKLGPLHRLRLLFVV